MAELALVASIFGVAAFGTKVATSLYEAAEIMIHAHQQIASMAKHVSQFTAILRHLGRVLEAEKGSCSDDLLCEIRKIKRSCKTTFKQINLTFQSRRYRPVFPVRWLFKHSQARELEARLDSQQSMLQVMIHTVTVSKLGDMHSKSKEDSKQISGLSEEIHILKNLIIENHNNLIELQRAEQSIEAETRHHPSPEAAIRQATQLPSNQREFSPGCVELDGLGTPFRSSLSTHSESDDEDSNSDVMANSTRRTSTLSRDQYNLEQTQSNNHAADTIVGSAVQPLSAYNSTAGSSSHRASTVLLQMVPYRSRNLETSPSPPGLLIDGGPGENTRPDTEPKPVMEEVTRSVRLLLDKWTTLGSAPVADVLRERVSNSLPRRKNPKGNRDNEYRVLGTPSRPRQPSRKGESTDGDINSRFYASSEGCGLGVRGAHRPLQGRLPMTPAPAWAPAFETSNVRTADVWKFTDTFGSTPSRYTSHSLLNRLRLANGGIVYMKRSELQHAVYVDDLEIYRFNLVPSSLLTPEASLILHTEIGNGWVRQEALDLLGYSYSETPSGKFSIPRNLYFKEITELVRLSFQSFSRGLEERSRQIIEERGWLELVESKQEIPLSPREDPRSPDADGDWMLPWDRYPNSAWKHIGSDYSDSDTDGPPEDRKSFSGPHNAPVPMVDRSTKAERNTGRKRPAAEKRFTLPRMDSTQHTHIPPMIYRTDERELRKGEEKLGSIAERRNETLAVSEQDIQPFPEEHAIPDTKSRNKRSKRVRKRSENSAPIKKPGHVPPTVTEINSELSADSEGFLRR